MEVETYEALEVTSAGVECDAEAVKLIDELELDGQKSLVKADGKRVPYRAMTATEFFVYSTLMTQRAKLKDYRVDSIPLRVLQVAAHAKPLYKRIEVWHAPEGADVKDPVLVGIVQGNPQYDWDEKQHILARWGDVLVPLSDLLKTALAAWKRATRARVLKARQELEGDAAALELVPDDAIPPQGTPSYTGLRLS